MWIGKCRRSIAAWTVCFGILILILSFAQCGRAQDASTPIPRKLTLKEAVTLAVSNSRDLALARVQYGLVQREAGVMGSAFRPNLYTGTGAAYTSGFPLLAGGGAPAVFNLSYSQQIFNPPLKGEQRAAQQRAEGQRFSMEGVRDAVMVRAALGYLELAKVRHALELMHSERLSASRILDATRERADAGRELPIDVTRAQLTSAKIEQRIAQLEDRDETLSGQLRDMMGLPDDQPLEVSNEDFPIAALDATNQLVAEALANNTDLKVAEAEKRAREEKLKGERGGYWPTFALTGQYNVLSKFNNYGDFFNKFQRNNVIFGVEVRIPIFASRTKSAVAFAREDLNAASLELAKKRSELSLDVRQKARQVHEADLGGEVARLELKIAQENVQVLQAQFDQGRGSLKDLEDAHIDENNKWLAYLDANYARQQAELDLLEKTGQLSKVLQ
ncbi:MAG TPA: TolC family protein [Candidatus Dormibacteraeota bacterium]|nr:TolC family protein [Candidatus Dormibacteraeota bacterium]